MNKKVRDIKKSLLNKGFLEDGAKADHVYFRFFLDGKRTSISTHYSHGEIDIGPPLISLMSREMKLKKEQFLQFVDCHMDGAAYAKILLDGQHIRREENKKMNGSTV